jgi:hypothetical protein
MKRAQAFIVMLLLPSLVMGATYYASDCATGGDGSQGSPYCLDYANDGVNESIMVLFDGVNSGNNHEAAAGDTIYLCAGACDGSGSTTYHVSNTHASPYYWFCSTITGTSGAPITIQNYPGEKIIINGNSDSSVDGNGFETYQSGTDVDNLINNACSTGIRYIQWKGNDISNDAHCASALTSPEDCKGLIFEKSGGIMALLQTVDVAGTDPNTWGINGPTGWSFDGVVMRYSGPKMWSGVSPPISFLASTCTNNQNQTAILVEGVEGPFTVKNSVFHSICGFVHRDEINNAGGGAFLFDNNEYYNAGQVTADFGNVNPVNPNLYSTFTVSNNYIHDVNSGIIIKERNRGWDVVGNTIACLGVWQVDSAGRCFNAIQTDQSTTAPGFYGTTCDIKIRKNRIIQAATSDPDLSSRTCPGDTACGWWSLPLDWATTLDPSHGYCSTSNSVIENNMISRWGTGAGGTDCDKASIAYRSDDTDVTIQNNTTYSSDNSTGGFGIVVCSTGAPTIKNNLIRTTGWPALETLTATSVSGVTFNNFKPTVATDTAVKLNGTGYSCNLVNQIGGSADSLPASNICKEPTLITTIPMTGDPTLWNLHLSASDTADKDAGTTGASDDIDGTSRPQGSATDIGADELAAAGGTGRRPYIISRVPMPYLRYFQPTFMESFNGRPFPPESW